MSNPIYTGSIKTWFAPLCGKYDIGMCPVVLHIDWCIILTQLKDLFFCSERKVYGPSIQEK